MLRDAQGLHQTQQQLDRSQDLVLNAFRLMFTLLTFSVILLDAAGRQAN